MDRVTGGDREYLNDIEQTTGATLKVSPQGTLCIKGSIESQKRAIRLLKEKVVSLAVRETHAFL